MNDQGTSIESLRTSALPTAAAAAESDRAVAEVQAAMTIAKRFPRDEDRAWAKIQKACRRPGLAEAALYAYTKGGSEVSGPSIRLAEELARDWGNISFGWKILSQDEEVSEVRAEAWDLETNVPAYITFTVPHHFKSKGQVKRVTDPREVYELIANQASRRLRACILRVIPGDVQDMAVDQCEKTLKDGGGKPLGDRVRDMLAAFQNDHNVTKDMIEKRAGKKVEAINETELVALRRIFVSLRDGMGKVEDYFKDQGPPSGAQSSEDLKKPAAAQGSAPSEGQSRPNPRPDLEGSAADKPGPASAAVPASEEKKPTTQLPDSMHVVTERGRVLTTIAYTPKLGDTITHDDLPWRVIEITDRVIVRAGEKAPSQPRPAKEDKPAAGDPPITVEAVIEEIMGAENLDALNEARDLVRGLPERDQAAANALAKTKENQLKGNRTVTPRKRTQAPLE